MPKGYPRSSGHGLASTYYNGCRCEPCKEASKEFRKTNPKIKVYAKNSRSNRLKLMEECKKVPCKDCSISYPPYVMDFDHRNPEEKSFAISQAQGCSVERFLEEISKCDVVCANCHRERTFKGKAYK